MANPLRKERLITMMFLWEKKQIDREAKEANLNTSDYVREKLGLTKARKSRTPVRKRKEDLENPQGDPENAVDVEELAREIFARDGRLSPFTMADARREAKHRLASTNA